MWVNIYELAVGGYSIGARFKTCQQAYKARDKERKYKGTIEVPSGALDEEIEQIFLKTADAKIDQKTNN